LSNSLLEHKFERGKVDTTLFIKKTKKNILLVQIYVDGIIFGATNDALCKEFAKTMKGEFEMSRMGELSYSLGLQIKQLESDIFINQSKYCIDLLKKFGIEKSKKSSTPMATMLYLDHIPLRCDNTSAINLTKNLVMHSRTKHI